MDLVPAALLQNIRTEKSYTPDQPGEFSGGLVKMNTVDFPRSPILKLSYGTGFGSTTTFKDFARLSGRQPGLARIRRRDPRAAERDSQPETDASWTLLRYGFYADRVAGLRAVLQQRLDASRWSERDSQPEFQLHGRQHLRQVGSGPGPFPRQQIAPAAGKPELLPFGGSGEALPLAGIRDGLQHPLHPDRHHRQLRLRAHRQQPDPVPELLQQGHQRRVPFLRGLRLGRATAF